jgi:hypothetical protein
LRKASLAVIATALLTLLVFRTANAGGDPGFTQETEPPGLLDRMGFTPRSIALPGNGSAERIEFDSRGRMVPNGILEPPIWRASVKSGLDGKTYNDVLLGSVPTDGGKANIGMYVIGWQFEFANGLKTDTRQPSCNDSKSVYDRFTASPLVNDQEFSSNGVALGNREFVDAFQTAEFTGEGFPSTWRTNFVPQTSDPRFIVDVQVPAADGTATAIKGCPNPIGYIKMSWFDSLDQYWIQKLGFSHAYVPFSLFNNTVMYTGKTYNAKGSCCVIGYHSYYGTSSYNQVYGVGSYMVPGIFSGLQDVAALSHELAELTNDPFVNNPTPAWGHTGQVSGCQGNFEVGDPLSGTEFSDSLGGFNYHLQDLAFFSWFYRITLGTANKYSFEGTFTKSQSTCKS